MLQALSIRDRNVYAIVFVLLRWLVVVHVVAPVAKAWLIWERKREERSKLSGIRIADLPYASISVAVCVYSPVRLVRGGHSRDDSDANPGIIAGFRMLRILNLQAYVTGAKITRPMSACRGTRLLVGLSPVDTFSALPRTPT